MEKFFNLCEILKDCPSGTRLWSPLYGNVTLFSLDIDTVTVKLVNNVLVVFKDNGYLKFNEYNKAERSAEIMLYPSIDQRDWSKWECPKPKKPKFDPKTLKPFDKVLARDVGYREWIPLFFSHINAKGNVIVLGCAWMQVVPYNDETKHLVGTTDEAPEYYRYWED